MGAGGGRSMRRTALTLPGAGAISASRSAPMSGQPAVFDRALLKERRCRAAALGPATFLIDRVAQDLADRLGAVLRRFDLAVDLASPSDALAAALARLPAISTLVTARPSVSCLGGRPHVSVVADEE